MDTNFPLDKHRPTAYIKSMTPEELQAWRRQTGYSQSQLAKVLCVDTMTVSRWERGVRHIPSFLALALECVEKKGGEDQLKGTKKKKGKGE